MGRKRQTGGDPKWIAARFNSKCRKSDCKATIYRGESIYYYPSDKTVLCHKCGVDASSEFAAAVFDEAMFNGGF